MNRRYAPRMRTETMEEPVRKRIVLCLLVLWVTLVARSGLGRATGPLAPSVPEEKIKAILDTDIGSDIDDAWALAFVIAHRPFEPLGITIADGSTPARAKIACKAQT